MIDKVRRQKLKYAGVYVNALINGVKTTFTVDTGATKTIISENFFF